MRGTREFHGEAAEVVTASVEDCFALLAEIDLLLELPGSKLWAVEIKRSLSPKVERGFHIACDDLKPARRLVVYAGDDRVPMSHDVEAVGLHDLARQLTALA